MQRRDVIATGTDVGGLFYGKVSKRIAVRRKNENLVTYRCGYLGMGVGVVVLFGRRMGS